MSPGLLLLNGYPATGIGDFGLELRRELGPALGEYLETRPDGSNEFRQLRAAIRWDGPIVANIGLTAWGSSGVRNFVGFLGLAARSRLRGRTLVLVHNLIEALDTEGSGYPVSPAVRAGAHRAVAMLRGARLVAFSRTVGELLRTEYGTPAAIVTPIPCRPVARANSHPARPPTVITPGYLSPYKGHARIPEVKARLSRDARFIVVGGPHRVLMETDQRYRTDLERVLAQLAEAGIDWKGRVEDVELDRLLVESRVALLPYTSTQGGSAMFSRIASCGIPVVAPRLTEFEWLESLGAGVVLTSATSEALAEGLRQVLDDDALRQRLADRQVTFAEQHSWRRFLDQLNHFAAEES